MVRGEIFEIDEPCCERTPIKVAIDERLNLAAQTTKIAETKLETGRSIQIQPH